MHLISPFLEYILLGVKIITVTQNKDCISKWLTHLFSSHNF